MEQDRLNGNRGGRGREQQQRALEKLLRPEIVRKEADDQYPAPSLESFLNSTHVLVLKLSLTMKGLRALDGRTLLV